jgi:hypothetical protein
MEHGKFATAINCMDGRTQLPVIDWVKRNYGVDFVDMITEPGPDRLFSSNSAELDSIRQRVAVSVNAHGSRHLVVVAHHDCAGNPVSAAEHEVQLRRALDRVLSWGLPLQEVAALWIGDDWKPALIAKVQ